VRPQFRIDQRGEYWCVDVFYISDNSQEPLFQDWEGFEEPFSEDDYQRMKQWCDNTFKTWLAPRRARRMAYNQFYFKSKRDLDWFILHWSGVDIPMV
jgi:hypothetical protein